MGKKTYTLYIVDRKTKEIIQTETRKSLPAFDRLWQITMSNVNSLAYKLYTDETIPKDEGK